jgi:ATP-dependent DNA helicase RecG
VAQLRIAAGILELAWFQGINWVVKNLHIGSDYLVFGKTGFFNGKPQIVHPEIEPYVPANGDGKDFLEPVYPTTEN